MAVLEIGIFESAHGELERTGMISFEDFDDALYEEAGVTQKLIEKAVKYLNVPLSKLYYDSGNLLHPFCYYDNHLYIDINNFSMEFLEFFKMKERIEIQRKMLDDYMEEKDYITLFGYIDKRLLFNSYEMLFNEIPLDQKYDAFTKIYTRSEYGFGQYNDMFMSAILDTRKFSKEYKERMEKLDLITWGEKEITVYRGEGSKSLPIDLSYSWTLDQKTAFFFANRFGQEGKLYEAKVDKENILDYFDDRNEDEVLIIPKNIKNAFVKE